VLSTLEGNRTTYEGDKDVISSFNIDLCITVLDHVINLYFAIQSKCSREADTFHRVVEENIICFRGVEFCQPVDFREVLLPFSKVVIKGLRKLVKSAPSLINSY
jgi:hypothetical protein